MAGTLGERLAERDAERYVGREADLAFMRDFLTADDGPSVAFVHGPAGIGKSALLRRVVEEARGLGFETHWVDGRELPPVPDALEDALAGARSSERPLVVIDTYDRVAALDGYVRGALLPALPDAARILISSRVPPDAAWREGGWSAIVVERRLRLLSDDEAIELLRAHGLERAGAARAIARWAEGSPLALTLAAAAARADPHWEPSGGLQRPEVVEPLIGRLAGGDLDPLHVRALGVAAIARQTTPEMLADVLTDVDGAAEFRWLAQRSFVESLGEGIAPHELVRRALRADLRRREPMLERDLRRRIADHLWRRATATGNLLWIIDLAHLVENPALRWGFSWDAAARYRVDDPRPGDSDQISRLLGPEGERREQPGRFLADAPEHVAICRDAGDRVCGFAVSMTPAAAPDFAADDPVLGPRLEHARAQRQPGEAIVWRSNMDLVGDATLGVIGLLGMATVLRSATGNPRYGYLPIDPSYPGAREFAAAAGGEHVPALDTRAGRSTIECHVIDWGPGGLLAAQREAVYRELGLPPPPRPKDGEGAGFEAVRAALRGFSDDRVLAQNELANGEGRTERAAAARERLREALGDAFGDTEREALLRRVLERGYIDPAPSHELAADELHLSRASYFRRLREATERVAEQLSGD